SMETLQDGGLCMQQLLPGARQPELLFVDALLATVQFPANAREGGFRRYCRESALRQRYGIAAGAQEAQLQRFDGLFHSVLQRGKQFGRSGRGGSAQVGNEIGDGEVRLMPDGRNYGNSGPCYRSGETLDIKRSEVLGRATTAGDDDCIDGLHAVEMKDARGELSGCLLALHRCRVERHIEASVPPADDVEEVVNYGAG